MSYEAYQPSILPAWLQNQAGLDWAAVLGNLKDRVLNGVRTAAISGMPLVGPVDALPAIGYERQLVRGISETDEQYALRLWGAWEAWKRAGTPLGILLQLEALYPGVPMVLVQQAHRAYSLDPDTTLPTDDRLIITYLPGGWRFDANGGLPLSEGHWNRFGLLFPGPLPPTWVDVQAPPTPSTLPSINEVNTITSVVLKWKPAKALFMGTWVVVSGRVWGWPPTQAWGDPGLLWGNGSQSVHWNPTIYP